MDLEIIKENENKLLGRKEFELKVKGIPKRKELVKKIAALKNSKEELVVVKRIAHQFGETCSVIDARVYKDMNFLKRVEPEYMLKRHSLKEEKKEAEKTGEKKEAVKAETGDKKKASEAETGEKKKETKAEDKENKAAGEKAEGKGKAVAEVKAK